MPEAVLVPTPRSPDLATFRLLAEGEAISQELHLLNATVASGANRIPWARFVFRDGDVATQTFALSEAETFAPGARIEFKLGYHGTEKTVFDGIVTRHAIVAKTDRPTELIVECRHLGCKMTLARKSRQFADVTDADIANTILSEYELAGDIADTRVTHRQMVQFNLSDWDFLLLRARANGLLVAPGLDDISLIEPDYDADAALSLVFGTCLEMFEGELDARLQSASVAARAWDPAAQESVESTTDAAGESSAGQPGAAALAEAVGSPTDAAWHAGAVATDELETWAKARLGRQRSAKLRGRARCQGFAEIAPGDLLELSGLGERFNGKAFVGAVRHEFALGIWKTDLQLGLDPEWLKWDLPEGATAAGLLAAPKGLHIGVVRQLEGDPEGNERILVQLPVNLPDGEGLWARLATPEAGGERGFDFRPEIGDEVVVGFFESDPRHPVVLGALHSSANAAHIAASDDNHQKGYLSRGKLKIYFDDENKVLTLATEKGNTLVLSEQDSGITLEDQNGNKLVMDPEGITIESKGKMTLKAASDVKVEGVNIEAKASAAAKIEGSASASFSSGGQAEVKGSLVRIN
jgi:Rhs element Vgr protein